MKIAGVARGRCWAVLSSVLLAVPTLASPEEQPVITSVRLEGTNVLVTARVPAGIKRVTLEYRSRLGSGAWAPRALARMDGTGGELTFRVPRSDRLEVLRVRADDQEPLPASFYSGTNSFSGQPTSAGDMAASFGGPTDVRDAGPAAGEASREVVESDIWKIRGDRLYFFNQYRGLQILDITNPDTATLKGTFHLPAAGEEMYLLGANHAVLLARDGCGWTPEGPESQAVIVNVEQDSPQQAATIPIRGYIMESRLVGSALYVASQAYQVKTNGTNGVVWEWGTIVSSFDLTNPAAPVARDTLWFAGYGHVVSANDVFLFVVTTPPDNNWWKSVVRCIDISAPDGAMREVGSVTTAGRVADKFKLNWRESVLTSISEVMTDGRVFTKLETFRLPQPAPGGTVEIERLGRLELGERERLHATRFDGQRVYVVTFFTQIQRDPLWVVDLSDPVAPRIAGELEVPGFSTYIQPLGDRLAAVGVETNRATVSLFDVSDPAKPGLLSRVPLGNQWSWSEANNNEDAFVVLPGANLILVPFSGSTSNSYIQAVQLIDLNRDSLVARGVIERPFVPRRATLKGDRVMVISGLEFLSVDVADRDHPQTKLELPLVWSVDRLFVHGDYLVELTTGAAWWGEPSGASLRVALASDPERQLTRVDLPKTLPILGAAVRGDRLYVAQGLQSFGIVPLPEDDNGEPPDKPSTVYLSIYDLRGLPALPLRGQTEAAIDSLGWGATFQLVWPNPGLLVLAGGGGGYWDPWLMWDMRPVPGGGLWGGRPVYWGGNGGRLIAFDVADDTAPRFRSDLNLAVNEWWNFSSAHTANGLVYLSHQGYIKPTPIILCDDTTGRCTTNVPPEWVWMQRYYLDVVDYADPVEPTVRKPVNIPGTLQGLSHGGEVLYTTGPHWETETNWWYNGPEYLDASAYDGVEAHLIDSLALSQSWWRPVLVKGATVFVGRAAETTPGDNLLESWQLSGAGKFAQLGKVTLESPASSLASFGDLLTVQGDRGISLYNATDAAALKRVGGGLPDGCVWFDLRYADGALDRGLWLPLGIYGVETIPVLTP